MKHVMIDLETLGTSADSVFLSVAAVQFDLEGETGKKFSMNIDIESALREDRKISGSTLQWWLEQKPEILKLMFKNACELREVLYYLSQFIYDNELIYPWGNSASFDLGMLTHAYSQLMLPLPWKFYNERCYRTAWMIGGLVHYDKPDLAHDPLVDCYYQIDELRRLQLKD